MADFLNSHEDVTSFGEIKYKKCHSKPLAKIKNDLLKKKHTTLCRKIKFDKANMDLKLDFYILPSKPWRTIRPDQAKHYANLPRNDVSSYNARSCSPNDISDLLGDPAEAST